MSNIISETQKELLERGRKARADKLRGWRENPLLLGSGWRIRRSDDLNWNLESKLYSTLYDIAEAQGAIK